MLRLAIALLMVGASRYATMVQGRVYSHWGTTGRGVAIASIGMVLAGDDPADQSNHLFCEDVDAKGEVKGMSEVIPQVGRGVVLEGYSFTAAGCTGVHSLPAKDTVIVKFVGMSF